MAGVGGVGTAKASGFSRFSFRMTAPDWMSDNHHAHCATQEVGMLSECKAILHKHRSDEQCW